MHNNPFDLPENVLYPRRVSMSDTSMGRLDSMTNQISTAKTDEQLLCEFHANLELLYIKAKNFHWNVKGVGFQGVHEMFDKIQDYAVSSSDRVAERMRYYDYTVRATAQNFLDCAWFSEGNSELNQDGMLSDMSLTLQCFHDHIVNDLLKQLNCPVSQNMVQDICEQLDKFNYFVKSNICCDEMEKKVSAY